MGKIAVAQRPSRRDKGKVTGSSVRGCHEGERAPCRKDGHDDRNGSREKRAGWGKTPGQSAQHCAARKERWEKARGCRVQGGDRRPQTAIGNPRLSMPSPAAGAGCCRHKRAKAIQVRMHADSRARRKPRPSIADAPLTFTLCAQPRKEEGNRRCRARYSLFSGCCWRSGPRASRRRHQTLVASTGGGV